MFISTQKKSLSDNNVAIIFWAEELMDRLRAIFPNNTFRLDKRRMEEGYDYGIDCDLTTTADRCLVERTISDFNPTGKLLVTRLSENEEKLWSTLKEEIPSAYPVVMQIGAVYITQVPFPSAVRERVKEILSTILA